MPEPSEALLLSDSSTLINFLRVGRRDLLTNLDYRLLVTDLVRQEISRRYHCDELEVAISLGEISGVSLTEISGFQAAGHLLAHGLGDGEAFSIVAAQTLGAVLGIDDATARKVALEHYPDLVCMSTPDVVLENIRLGRLTIADADALKELWRTRYRFALKTASFGDLSKSF